MVEITQVPSIPSLHSLFSFRRENVRYHIIYSHTTIHLKICLYDDLRTGFAKPGTRRRGSVVALRCSSSTILAILHIYAYFTALISSLFLFEYVVTLLALVRTPLTTSGACRTIRNESPKKLV
jgi:hypothetical protein